MGTRLKLSTYAFDMLTSIGGKPIGLFFSGRTGKNVFVSPYVFNSVKQGNLDNLDFHSRDLLIKSKILVPQEEDEFVSVNLENREILAIQNKRYSSHLYISIQPTANCQLACSYCGQEHKSKQLDHNTICRIENDINKRLSASKYTDLEIGWFGGEPLCALGEMREINHRIVNLANKHNIGVLCHITTNGYALSADVYRELKEDFNCKRIEITLDGCKEYHDKHRYTRNGHGSFEKIYNNLQEIISSGHYDKNVCMITIRCNVDLENIEGVIPLLHKLCSDNIQDKIRFYCACVVSWANNGAVNAKTWELIGKKSTEYILYMREHGFEVDTLPHRSAPYVCLGTMKEAVMYDAYGNIYDCSETAYSNRYCGGPLHLGNLGEENSIRQNSVLMDIPQRLMTGKVARCKDCKYYPLCGGLCPLAIYEGEPRCPMFVFNLKDRMLIHAICELSGKNK